MTQNISLSEEVYAALQLQATRQQQPVDALAEDWLKQHLNLDAFPELEWRQGPGGWRVGIKGTAIDVYTIVGYSQAGYDIEMIADLFPYLSAHQIRSALRYYADYPREIDQALAENEPEIMRAKLYRTIGPDGYRRLTGNSETPKIIRELQTKYNVDETD